VVCAACACEGAGSTFLLFVGIIVFNIVIYRYCASYLCDLTLQREN